MLDCRVWFLLSSTSEQALSGCPIKVDEVAAVIWVEKEKITYIGGNAFSVLPGKKHN